MSKEELIATDVLEQRKARRYRNAAVALLSMLLLLATGLGLFAENRRRVAEERLTVGHGAAEQMLRIVDDHLATLSGASEPRRRLLEAARGVLDGLAVRAAPTVRSLQMEALTGALLGSEALAMGDDAKVSAEHARALGAADKLIAMADPRARIAATVAWLEVGTAALSRGDYSEARSRLEASARALPQDSRELATVLDRLAVVDRREGKLAQARAKHEQALRIAEQKPDERKLDIAQTRLLLAEVDLAQGRLADAAAGIDRAIQQLDGAEEQSVVVQRTVIHAELLRATLGDGDVCAELQSAALGLLEEEKTAEDRVRMADALSVCQFVPPELAPRLVEAKGHAQRLARPDARFAGIAAGAAGRARAMTEPEAAARLLREAVATLEPIASHNDGATIFALARSYQVLLSIPAEAQSTERAHWARRCLTITSSPSTKALHTDCLITIAPNQPGPEVLAGLQAAEAELAGAAGASSKLRRFQVVYWVATLGRGDTRARAMDVACAIASQTTGETKKLMEKMLAALKAACR